LNVNDPFFFWKDLVTPTSIQAQAIPAVLSGCDFIGRAETGSGKVGNIAINQMIKDYLLLYRRLVFFYQLVFILKHKPLIKQVKDLLH
jgi:superfamily II DNA/RNA helicase